MRACHVVNMRVRDYDGFHLQTMFLEYGTDLLDLIPWIDDYRFSRLLIAENRAVTLQNPDWKKSRGSWRFFILSATWLGTELAGASAGTLD